MQKVINDNTLSAEGKESVVSKIKQPIEAEYPTADKWFLGYNTLEGILRLTDDPDYRAMPAQAAQNAIRQCIQSWESYFKLMAKWKKDHCRLLGRPKIPKYKGGIESHAVFSNQLCTIKADSNKSYMKFPGTKLKLHLGSAVPEGCTLMQTEVMPKHGVYEVILILEDGIETPEPAGKPERIASIDLGVDNFAAITDNTGSRPVLIKGKVLKAKNQWYNKEVAKLQAQIVRDSNGKPTSCMKNHVLQARINRIWDKRDQVIGDFMHKAAKAVVHMLKDREVDTLVVGRNKGWKQNSSMGETNNQNFAGIPFYKFTQILEYLCQRKGIRYVEQEESYTSKASFLDCDSIPVYGEEPAVISFSGKRVMRGLYCSSDCRFINADINGSLNILRKAFPDIRIHRNISNLLNPEVWDYNKFYKQKRCCLCS